MSEIVRKMQCVILSHTSLSLLGKNLFNELHSFGDSVFELKGKFI